jgi:cytochrome c553
MRWQAGNIALAFASALLATLASAAQTNELREALARNPNHEHGSSLYETCAACHQPDGAGVADGDIPSIAGQHYDVIIKQLVDFRDTERVDLRMNAFAARHHLKGSQDLADVAAFISGLPPQRTDEVGTGQFAAVGAQAYRRACASCHGADAEGKSQQRYPRLAGQHYGYLVKQIDMMIGDARLNASWDHSKLLGSLTDEEKIGVADYLARLTPVPASPAN